MVTSRHNRREDQTFVISIDQVSDPLFEERFHQWYEMGVNVALKPFLLKALALSSSQGRDENHSSLSQGYTQGDRTRPI
ncbi:hypothetical protein AVEN_194550-1 [Araneus ventricosus]|uniref:Uncharacterized protein n=1 Tax=Araneus ventricosus TaxID=182803 RepID=A0A4Y2A6I7_ARAVE|nr:hypothetical protein AVEN_194550-1 [Araneus ventricosus]